MRLFILLLAGGLWFWPVSAHADMIEVKGLGIMNGTVLAEDERDVQFKDAKGKMHVFAKANILFIEKEDRAKKQANAFKAKASEMMEALKKAPEAIKKGSDKLTEKLVGAASKPLDRSGADSKSAALAGALDQANQAAAGGTHKTMTFNREVYRQQNEAKEVADSERKSKGRFTSL